MIDTDKTIGVNTLAEALDRSAFEAHGSHELLLGRIKSKLDAQLLRDNVVSPGTTLLEETKITKSLKLAAYKATCALAPNAIINKDTLDAIRTFTAGTNSLDLSDIPPGSLIRKTYETKKQENEAIEELALVLATRHKNTLKKSQDIIDNETGRLEQIPVEILSEIAIDGYHFRIEPFILRLKQARDELIEKRAGLTKSRHEDTQLALLANDELATKLETRINLLEQDALTKAVTRYNRLVQERPDKIASIPDRILPYIEIAHEQTEALRDHLNAVIVRLHERVVAAGGQLRGADPKDAALLTKLQTRYEELNRLVSAGVARTNQLGSAYSRHARHNTRGIRDTN